MDKDILRKRLQTTMIAALDEFEKSFGYLWGVQKPLEEPLTEKEEKFLNIWEDTRNRILNRGNNQIRKCMNDIDADAGKVKYNYYLSTQKGSDNEK